MKLTQSLVKHFNLGAIRGLGTETQGEKAVDLSQVGEKEGGEGRGEEECGSVCGCGSVDGCLELGME